MAFDENFNNEEEKLTFNQELDQYLESRHNQEKLKSILFKKSKTKQSTQFSPNKSTKSTRSLTSLKEKFIRWKKARKLAKEQKQKEILYEQEQEAIQEQKQENKKSRMIEEQEDQNEIEDQKENRSFFKFIKSIFKPKRKIQEEFEEDEKFSIIFLDNELKAVFKFTNKVLKNLTPRELSEVKRMDEFKEYREVIQRYNQRVLKRKQQENQE